jgi:hypothetical protein
MSRGVSSWLREPALHFAAIGIVLFALHWWVQPRTASAGVQLSADAIGQLEHQFTQQTGRPAAPAERSALRERFLDDEVLYREAMELGLDRGDPIVRRRLIQKMAFFLEDTGPDDEPTLDELADFLAAHADRYREPPRVTFHDVFFSRDRRGDALERTCREASRALQHGGASEGLGDQLLIGHGFALRTPAELESLLGPGFARQVFALEPGRWSDPIASSYGLHVVNVDRRIAGRIPDLAAVRARVRADLVEARREDANRTALARLREKYGVTALRRGEP